MAGRNPMFNSSGCKDLTAYHAIGNIIKEEKELDKRVHNLISVLKFINCYPESYHYWLIQQEGPNDI